MAFEVARVHQLICSRVGDEDVFNTFKNSSYSGEVGHGSPQSCSPQGTFLRTHYPADFAYDLRGYDQVPEYNNLPLESLSCYTETECNEEDDLLHNLAQQIAHSMLDEEETKAEICAGLLNGSGYSDARDLLSEGRVSPSSWSSGSWSSGPLLSGSQSSSKGSSRVSSQVSSPSSAPSAGYQDAWDTLFAPAGEVVRLKMNEEKKVPVFSGERPSQTKVLNQALRAHLPQQTRHCGQLPIRTAPSQSTRRKEENLTANTQAQQNWASKCAAMNAMASQGRSHYQHFQQNQQAFSVDGQQAVNNYRHPGKLVDSKTLQRNRQTVLNGGSGVRVVFLGASTGRESCGTGVFLPRTFGSGPEHKKKNDGSTLIAPMHGCVTGAPIHAKTPKEGVWPTLQQSMNRSSLRQPVVHEPCLPTEWTY